MDDDEARLRRNQIRTNRIASTIGILLLLANLVALLLTAWQAKISRQASAAADVSARAAQAGVNVSRDTLSAMRDSDAAQRKEEQGEFKTQVKQSHIDDRAWILPKVEKLHEIVNPVDGTPSGFYMYGIGVQNIGKTLGMKIVVKINRIFIDRAAGDTLSPKLVVWEEQQRLKTKSDKDPDKYEELEHLPLPNSLAPGASSIEDARVPVDISGQHRSTVEMMVGRLEYADIFGEAHWAGFCYLIETSADLIPCATGNDQEN